MYNALYSLDPNQSVPLQAQLFPNWNDQVSKITDRKTVKIISNSPGNVIYIFSATPSDNLIPKIENNLKNAKSEQNSPKPNSEVYVYGLDYSNTKNGYIYQLP